MPETRPAVASNCLPDGSLPTPDWVPSDDVIASDPDRQVLVVGETVVGLALAHLLRRAGYDPVLVAGADPSPPSRVTFLWPPAVQTLAAVDVGTVALDRGVAVDSLSVSRLDTRGEETVSCRDVGNVDVPPVVVRTRDLRRALADRLPDRQHGGNRTVERVSSRDDGLAVEFGDGVREWFDVVVDAGAGDVSPGSRDGADDESPVLWQSETTVETGSSASATVQERWSPNAVVERLPVPDGSDRLLRVTTVERGHPPALDPGLADVAPTGVSQETVPDTESFRERWATGRIACCGEAAWPLAPATGARASLGIEDALAFVRQLTRETGPVSDAVDVYGARRAGRTTALGSPTHPTVSDREYPLPESPVSPLGTLAAIRAVSMGPFLGPSLVDRQRAGFDR